MNLTKEQQDSLVALIEDRSALAEALDDATKELISWYSDNVTEVECTKCSESKAIRVCYEMYREIVKEAEQ